MSTGARVESVDSIKEFRVYLAKFQENAGLALGDADSDVNKTVTWLETEQQTYWSGQIRKRQEAVTKAEDAVRGKKLFKDASGSQQSAIEEQKALQIAKAKLAEAQQKMVNVKGWQRKLQKEIVLYRGGVGRFAGAVSGGIPAALAHLGNTIENIEKYLGLAAATGEEAGEAAAAGAFSGAGAGASVKRAVEDAPALAAEAGAAVDPAAIRAAVPGADTLASAAARAGGLFGLATGMITPEQQQAIATLGGAGSPADDDRVGIQESAVSASRIFLLHQPGVGQPGTAQPGTGGAGIWRLGSVDTGGAGEYNTVTVAELRASRLDVADLLRLPVGSLVIVGPAGIEAIYDANDQHLLNIPAPAVAEQSQPVESAQPQTTT
jgi:hypothetical protein